MDGITSVIPHDLLMKKYNNSPLKTHENNQSYISKVQFL